MTLRGVRIRQGGDLLVKKPIYYQLILDSRESDVHHSVFVGMVARVPEHLSMSQNSGIEGIMYRH